MKLLPIAALLVSSTPALACDWGMTKYTCYQEDNDSFNLGCRTRTAVLRGCAWTQVEAQASCLVTASVRLWWNNWLPDYDRDCSNRPATPPPPPPPAMGTLKLCNLRTTGNIDYALNYFDNGSWFVKGWWGLTPGQCQEYNYEVAYGIYAYAQSNSWSLAEGEARQCVHPINAFERYAGGECNSGEVVKHFKKFASTGVHTWNFTE